MASVKESRALVDDVLRLRRAERLPDAAPEVRPVRRNLESRLGPTLSRSRAAGILGVSQTALDRWVAGGQIPIVIAPGGRREVPRRFVIELRESIDELLRHGRRGRPLAAALAARREAAERFEVPDIGSQPPAPSTPRGHQTAELRSRAVHAAVAERLDRSTLEEAREEVDRLTAEGHLHERYAERWRKVLDGSRADIAAAIVADTPEGRDLRQNSPFAGALNEQERRRLIERTR